MSTTVTYKGETLTTVDRATKTLKTAGKYLEDDLTVVDTVPSGYYDMSGSMSWLGKNAELIDNAVYSTSGTLAGTSFNGWTPSTTAKTILSSANAKTFSADLSTYEYYLIWECKCDMDYTGASPTLKAHFLFSRCYMVQQIIKRPSTFANIQSGTFDGNFCSSFWSSNFLRYYGTTTGTMTYSWSASYGIYFGASSATFSNSTNDAVTVTIKTPTISARCSTTYFSTGNAEKVNQTNSTYSMSGKLYRVEKEGIAKNIYNHMVELINS